MQKFLLLVVIALVLVSCVDGEDPSNNTTSLNNTSNVNNTSNLDPCAGVDCSGHGTCVVDGSGLAACDCESGYAAEGFTCVLSTDPCAGVDCSGHGSCVPDGASFVCSCEGGYTAGGVFGEECLPTAGATVCDGIICSNNGTCREWTESSGQVAVCACDAGYTPSGHHGLDCVPVEQICVAGAINYDVDNDGSVDTWFEPTAAECQMFVLVNQTRATHDHEGAPECHRPLMYNVEWSAHGRNHSQLMSDQGGLFHADFPSGQNCAYGCDAACEIDMYMNGAGEPHCPELSHHCNIMRCSFSYIGIGTVGTWNTQNFY